MDRRPRWKDFVANPWFPPRPRPGGRSPLGFALATAGAVAVIGAITALMLPWWVPACVIGLGTLGLLVATHELHLRRRAWRNGAIQPGILLPLDAELGGRETSPLDVLAIIATADLTMIPAAGVSYGIFRPWFHLKSRRVRVLCDGALAEVDAYYSSDEPPPERKALVWVVIDPSRHWLLGAVAPPEWANEPMHESEARTLIAAEEALWENRPVNELRTAQAALNPKSKI